MKHYPPLRHGAIEQIFDGIHVVRGVAKMPMFVPVKISRSMTIIRHSPAGAPAELTIVNSMRLSEAGHAALDKLGKVTQVLRIAGFHGRDDGYFRERYGAKLFALEGQRYFRGFEAKEGQPNYLEPDVWLRPGDPVPIPGASLKVFDTSTPPEGVLLLERDGGILVTGDSLQNTGEFDEYVNFAGKMMMKKMGFLAPHAVGPGWLEFAKPHADDVRSVLDLDFEHVLPGHGAVVIGGAKEKYRPAVSGPLKGCHS